MNLNEEIRRDYLISAQMKKVWTIQIKMVQKLLEVCNHHNLKIWAEGGTLLGTIREHGYIPWDNDIDLKMFRDDYDKLLSIASQEFKSPFFFQSYKTDINYFRGHSQLRYDGTACILPGEEFCDFHQGIFIDIFVNDSIPNQFDEDWEWRVKKADSTMKLLYEYSHKYSVLNPSYLIKRFRQQVYCKIKNPLLLYEECEDLFRHYKLEENERVCHIMFIRNIEKIPIIQKEWYSSTIYMPFEDIELPVPVGYHEILSTQYGIDYMMPKKVTTLHGEFVVLDTEVSYKEYIPKLRKECWKRWRKAQFEKILKKNNTNSYQ